MPSHNFHHYINAMTVLSRADCQYVHMAAKAVQTAFTLRRQK